jgi:tetratricopeptide (TPR) repeat protein
MQRRLSRLVCALSFLLFSVSALMGQQHDMHAMGSHQHGDVQLGKVSLQTSCSPQVQTEFETGVAYLHSFEYDRARQHFQNASQHDSNCAMAYWGQAMSLYHELWGPPSQKDLADGWQLVEKGQAASQTSPREKEYIAAMAAYYRPGKRAMEERAQAYSDAMAKLHADNPSDEEATIFYALSLLASEREGDTSLKNEKEAVTLLNGVLAVDPNHPGVTHYLIHACDNPSMAKEGLAAARRYAKLAPSSPHAVHMPSHIFARLGLWQDDINSNLAAVAVSKSGGWGTETRLHPMDFLEYAYLQTGQDDKARTIVAEALAVKREGFSRGLGSYYFYAKAHFPALLALETRDWKAAESLTPPADAEPGVEAITYWAQAVGAGHAGDVAAAKAAVAKLDASLEAVRKKHPELPVPPVESGKNEAHAWLAFAEKKNDEAFALLKAVIDLQDRVGKGEVELPAREMYADMLLELNRPQEALEQYQLSLKSDPNRFNGLYGAGRAAELAHQNELAGTYYKQLLENCNQGEGSDRAELVEAKKFISEMASR